MANTIKTGTILIAEGALLSESLLFESEPYVYVFGSDEEKTTRKAIKQVVANLKSKNFNCLEITQVAAK
jgi:hypothetical protein